MNCPLCNTNNIELLYSIEDIPIWQNRIFDSSDKAKDALTARVSLSMCKKCSFVFNSDFDISVMNYNEEYRNEQIHSAYFMDYLEGIVELLIDKGFRHGKIIEIGCGKGHFLEKLLKAGFDVTGFDPAYEGDDPNIERDYFSNQYCELKADLIILRHTLEHIPQPYDFLSSIAEANSFKGEVYIEVPTLEWIVNKCAFWDIFYEHCNYFTVQSLGSIFSSVEQDLLFRDQYQFVIGRLSCLRRPDERRDNKVRDGFTKFNEKIDVYSKYVRTNRNIAIWGGGAKGSTFLNIIDPNRKFVECVIDVNPKKQGRFVGGTGHRIVGPNEIRDDIDTILVMNENYLDEIRSTVNNDQINVDCL